jgi:hypothetical protein
VMLPGWTVKETSLTAVVLPYRLLRFSTVIMSTTLARRTPSPHRPTVSTGPLRKSPPRRLQDPREGDERYDAARLR